MSIITLTTDLGNIDHYVATIKAAIFRQLPDTNIVDISHNVPPFNIRHAAFVVKNSYQEFPQGTIHIIGVNAESDSNAPHLAVYANGHYFIGAENGMFSLILDVKPDKIVELNLSKDSDNQNFPTKDVFAKAACHISRGGTLELIGKVKSNFDAQTSNLEAWFDKNVIKGGVMHIDNYGNAITNIKQELFNRVAKERRFSIYVGNREHYTITKIRRKYNQVELGEAVAIFISTKLLSISINQGSAAALMGLSLNDIIRIEFHD
jgi:S-adenosyl-L-methionine hydrolase (adenosine-forming)